MLPKRIATFTLVKSDIIVSVRITLAIRFYVCEPAKCLGEDLADIFASLADRFIIALAGGKPGAGNVFPQSRSGSRTEIEKVFDLT